MPTIADQMRNPYQYSFEDYNTSTPEGDQQAISYSPGYITDLLALQQQVMSGQGTEWDRESYQQQANAAMAIPMRDPSSLTYNAGEDAPDRLSGGSPDLGNLMLTLREKMASGTATPQESELFKTAYTMLADQNWRASVPQESDANPFGIGDNLFGALGTLALGATGGLAAAPLAAGGAGLATTLGSLGTLSGIAGTAAGVLGAEMDQDWLRKAGLGLGAVGGLAGGVGGLANLASTGINSLSDVARLAGNAGRVVGGAGAASDQDLLRQIGSYLSAAGQGGAGVDTLLKSLSGGVNAFADAARLAGGASDVAGATGRATGNKRLQQIAGLLGMAKRLQGRAPWQDRTASRSVLENL
jgi:hypothetical protein